MAVRDVNNNNNLQIVGDPISELRQPTTASATQSGPGQLRLDSDAAKKAVATSLNYLTGDRAQAVGINNANKELVVRSAETDELGMTHVRLDRVYNGLKVYGEQVVTHLGVDGNVRSVSGGSVSDSVAPINLNTRPSITSDDALKAAKKTFSGTPQSQTSELLVYPGRDGKYSLAYRVELTDL